MRFVIILGLAAGIATGCASKKKTDGTQATTPAADAKTMADKTKSDAKAMTKDAKKADETTAAGAAKIECKLKADLRILEIRAKDKGCELAYTKEGQENAIASSMNGSSHCESVQTRIKDKLEAAGYTCN